jgi:putative membrane protein
MKKETANRLTWIVSIVVPIVVAILFKVQIKGYDFSFLPPVYAGINALTAILLIVALIAIKNKKIKLHESVIKVCLALSLLFLVMYILYHMTSEPTLFEGTGVNRIIYYFILITHIILSVLVIPFVLITYTRAAFGEFEEHKKIAKVTFPLWLYVATTGVIVYLMISPYYK